MTAVLVALILAVAGLAAYALYLLRPLIDRLVVAHERKVSLVAEETEASVSEKRQNNEKPKERPPLPPGLLVIASQESEQWAREQMMDFYHDTYDETKDWSKVMGVAMEIQAQAIIGRKLN